MEGALEWTVAFDKNRLFGFAGGGGTFFFVATEAFLFEAGGGGTFFAGTGAGAFFLFVFLLDVATILLTTAPFFDLVK